MAKVDIKSPSEDEDFDVKADEAAATDATSTDTSSTDDSSKATEEEAPAEVNLSPEEPEASEEDAPEEPVEESESAEAETVTETPEEPAPEEAPVEEPEVSEDKPAPVAAPVAKQGVSTGRMVFEAVLVVAIIALGIWAWGLRTDRNNLEAQVAKLNADPQALVQKQADDLITRVSKLLQLPTGEQPTIANVTDAAAAKQQSAFFTNAQNGDKVLMYVKAGEAILYRPSTNKIILVAPLTFNSAAASTTTTKTTR